MIDVVVWGTGGHALEVTETLRQANGRSMRPERFNVLAYVDDSEWTRDERFQGCHVVTLDDAARHFADAGMIVAVGNTRVRRVLVERAARAGFDFFPAIISPRADMYHGAEVAQGCIVFAGAIISTNARLGRHVHVNHKALLAHGVQVGDFSTIAPCAAVAGDARIGAGCWIGMHAGVREGTIVSHGVTVGMGAMVVRDMPPNVSVIGVPARKHKDLVPW